MIPFVPILGSMVANAVLDLDALFSDSAVMTESKGMNTQVIRMERLAILESPKIISRIDLLKSCYTQEPGDSSPSTHLSSRYEQMWKRCLHIHIKWGRFEAIVGHRHPRHHRNITFYHRLFIHLIHCDEAVTDIWWPYNPTFDATSRAISRKACALSLSGSETTVGLPLCPSSPTF